VKRDPTHGNRPFGLLHNGFAHQFESLLTGTVTGANIDFGPTMTSFIGVKTV